MNKKVIIVPRYNLRVEDSALKHILVLKCDAGGHIGTVSAKVLHERLKPYDRLLDVAGSFRCSQCRRRGSAYWHIEERS